MHVELSKDILMTRGGILDTLLDTSFAQAIIVDKNERILFFSKSSEIFSGLSAQETVGRKIGEMVQDHKFTEVLKTGNADRGIILTINNKTAIANHIPIKDKGTIIGAIGIVYFSNLSTLKRLISRLSTTFTHGSNDLYSTLSRKGDTFTFNDYIGESSVVKRLIENIRNSANSPYPILLIGETGTGKEILANAIHTENSDTHLQPFVKLNCSSIPCNLLEAELFGYEKGAFTGAISTKQGKFEVANNGSILLDEIGEMDILLQSKLLRVLEEHEFERLGGNMLIPSNARVIASTNANLHRLCLEKRFRQDLYYRLNTLEIHVPPLRSRREDIPLLVDHFIAQGKYDIRFSTDAQAALMHYDWPGNVRELKNLVNRFGVLKSNSIITTEEIEEILSHNYHDDHPESLKVHSPSQGQDLQSIEKTSIEKALKSCGYNQTRTSQKLGIARTTLSRKIQRYNIQIHKA